MKSKNTPSRCSFCGASSDEVPVIPGPSGDVFICVECVQAINNVVGETQQKMIKEESRKIKGPPPLGPVPAPKAIKEFLDKYVIGHDDVKKVLSVAAQCAVWGHQWG